MFPSTQIIVGIEAADSKVKRMFYSALDAKLQGLKNGTLQHPKYDKLVFNKVKEDLGFDQLRYMVSGSAPIGENVMMFFRCLLGVPVLEGYGQTEGTALTTVAVPEDIKTVGHVGIPAAHCDITLEDVPEMGYLHTDRSHSNGQPCFGRGEICVRGPGVFIGYYKNEEKTKEALDSEGWLHSGDIGLWRPDGNLQIIDRKKNIFKLSQGEYVAPEKIENILCRSQLIEQVYVHGNSLKNYLVAVVVPDLEVITANREKYAGVSSNMSLQELSRLCQLQKVIFDDVKRLAKENGLQGFETPKEIALVGDRFSVENGILTPTQKLKRPSANDYFKKVIAEMIEKVDSNNVQSRL